MQQMRSVASSSSSTWLVSGAQYFCRCVCGKIFLIYFKLTHSITYAVLMAGSVSSYSKLYQEGRFSLFFSNLKHWFSGWYIVLFQFGHMCFLCFPCLVKFSVGALTVGVTDFIMLVICLIALSVFLVVLLRRKVRSLFGLFEIWS